jgi:hypothetical protein
MRRTLVLVSGALIILAAIGLVIGWGGIGGRPGMPGSAADKDAPVAYLPTLDVAAYCSGVGGRATLVGGRPDPQACLQAEERWLVILKYRLATQDITAGMIKACQDGLYGVNKSYAVFATCVQRQRRDPRPLSLQD